MNWPAYPHPLNVPDTSPLAVWQARREPTTGKVYTAAVDVWRDGVHLWRSYPAHLSQNADAWVEENLGEDVAKNHDAGFWRAAGVEEVGRWPVPTEDALEPVGSANELNGLLCTLLSIGRLPHPPDGLESVPKGGTITTRLWRASRPYIVLTFEFEGVSIRAMVGQVEMTADKPKHLFTAALDRRETRAGAHETDLGEPRSVEFMAEEDAKPNSLVRAAKAALDIPGWPAQRQGDGLVWHLARAPYSLTVSKTIA